MFQAFSKHFTFATNDQQKWIAVFGESGKLIRDFDRRFTALRKLNLFTEQEARAFLEFQKDRNRIFHDMAYLSMAHFGEEWKRVMENAFKADEAITHFFERGHEQPPGA